MSTGPWQLFDKNMGLEHILGILGNLDTPFFRPDLAKLGASKNKNILAEMGK